MVKNISEEMIVTLIKEAEHMRSVSYAPYSHYTVGAAILTNRGAVITGCNIENAAYGDTICAERCAAFKAVSDGHTKFQAIAICGGKENELGDYAFPCGSCRQVLREFSNPTELLVIVAKSVTDYKVYTLEDLLPESFGPDNLK